ncbi:symmetrical bis(5'-nucleosyl)-tetraphosphatase [soil metagenome]
MNYLIGDLQGCCDALEEMLGTIGFTSSRDHIYVLGDLVNRGPRSLDTLLKLQALGSSATCLLGNHDLHLLAAAEGVRKLHRGDTLADILAHPRRELLLDWVRNRPLAVHELGWLMVHAGVPPQWDVTLTMALAGEVSACLRGPDLSGFLRVMYGNEPARWRDDLVGNDRLRFAVNALTRIRFCSSDGTLDFDVKEGSDAAPTGLHPWFQAPGRKTAGVPVAFGHWSTLGLINRPDLLSLDTGCVWGGKLTAVRIDGDSREVIQVQCAQSQKPGKAA